MTAPNLDNLALKQPLGRFDYFGIFGANQRFKSSEMPIASHLVRAVPSVSPLDGRGANLRGLDRVTTENREDPSADPGTVCFCKYFSLAGTERIFMSRYFFDVENGHRLIDPAGLDCRNDQDAPQEGHRYCRADRAGCSPQRRPARQIPR